MKKEPLVSIIIPTYNRAHLIGETLDSVLAQTYQNWECIIVDDGSSDNTDEVVGEYVKEDNRFKYYHRPKEHLPGGNGARNYGFMMSQGNYVNWLDSDDLFKEKHLQIHLQYHFKAKLSCTITSALTFENNKCNIIHEWSKTHLSENFLADYISSKISWPIDAILWNKNFLNFGLFNEKLASSQEWEFHNRALTNDISFKIIDTNTVLTRRHEKRIGGVTSVQKQYSTFFSRYFIFIELSTRKLINKELEFHLLSVMLKSFEKDLKYKYYDLLLKKIKYLKFIIFNSNYKLSIFKILIISIPIYYILGKGEKLFVLKK